MTKYTGLEIAVIGMSGRFPDAENVHELWHNLKNGVESVRFHTDEELLADGEDQQVISDPLFVNANVTMEGKENFDAAFFGYRPDEAKLMDPQVRVFHECVWEALEDAGCIHTDAQKVGLFAGSSNNINWGVYSEVANQDKRVDNYSAAHLSNARFLATRLSYFFNLKGPSVYVDTACSTSLVAVHQACNSLIMGQCNIALAGGVTITNAGKEGYLYQEGMIHSRDGHCRTFDAAATGTIGGEGAGVVVLKMLKHALKDGDNIHAIIRGSAINNDGKEKVGYTAPSVEGQAETIMTAQKWAKVSPETISYVEAHGTATPLGDPIEIEALKEAFGTSDEKYCAIGSVKSNMGHLDAAAGITGLIKTVMALKHRQLPPSLNFEQPNPKINFENSPFFVNTKLREWRHGDHPLRAGVSSFGIGGTNAHVVLEEAPAPVQSTQGRDQNLLTVSGKSPAAVERNTQRLIDYLKSNSSDDLADVAYTLQVGRKSFSYRRSVVAGTNEQAIAQLDQQKSANKLKPVSDTTQPNIVFMFPGQGAQYVNMAKGLMEEEPVFKDVLTTCFKFYQQVTGDDLHAILVGIDEERDINQTQFTQPLLFSVEYALAQLLISWGIKADQMIGHSIGEYVAACLSGIFTLEDALKLVIKRGALMQAAPEGSMLSVSLSREEIQPYLKEFANIDLAADNTTNALVVAGPDKEIEALAEVLTAENIRNRILHTSHAFHSAMMEGTLEAFRQEVEKMNLAKAEIPVINNDNGLVDQQMEASDYWVNQIRKPVNFSGGLATLLKEPTILIEIGPGKSLSTFARNHRSKSDQHTVVNLMRHPNEDHADQAYLLQSIGQLWEAGLSMDHELFYKDQVRKIVTLPTYSFEKTPYPVRVNAYKMISEMISDGTDKKYADMNRWMYRPSWEVAHNIEPEKLSTKKVLIFAADMAVSTLVERYEADGNEVKVVVLKSKFAGIGDQTFTIGSSQIDKDLNTLFKSLKEEDWLPDILIHAFGLDVSQESSLCEYKNYYSLLDVLQAWEAQEPILNKQVVVLSSLLHPVTSEVATDQTCKSLAMGFLKVLSQEYTTVTTAHIDVARDQLDSDASLNQLYQELSDQTNGKVVALRHGARFLRFYHQLEKKDHGGLQFRNSGTYLITGGLGKLGFELSRHLLKSYEANLVLLDRTALKDDVESLTPDTKEWRMQELSQFPGQVKHFACNVTDEVALSRVVRQIESEWGPVHGVIHTAAKLGNHQIPLAELDIQEAKHQITPKISGVKAIERVFEGQSLDFCLLTSSLSAILGGLGFGAYAPANAYLDYFASASTSQKWISVNLDGLSFGEASDTVLTGHEVVKVLEMVLKYDIPQVIVSPTDLKARLDKWVNRAADEIEQQEQIPGDSVTSGFSLEEQVVHFWQDFFGNPTLDESDNFFEVGGDSLQALTMIRRIHQQFGTEISIKEFFNNASPKLVAEYIQAASGDQSNKLISIPAVARGDHHVLSSAQRRLYFLWQFEPDSLAYNMPKVLTLKGAVDKRRFENTFRQLIARNEVFRTAFVMEGKEPRQVVSPNLDFTLDHQLVTRKESAAIIDGFVKPFDLAKPDMIRATLLELKDETDEFLLLMDVHHIITDGVSLGLLIEEFIELYKGEELVPPTIQYVDFSEWQQQEEQQARILKQKEFWLEQFAEPVKALDLPSDRPRSAVKSYHGHSVNTVLSKSQTNQLKLLAEQEKATLFMVMLSLFNVLLSKLTNAEDSVIGTPVSGRPHPQLERVMGLFINTLPIRNDLSKLKSFSELLGQVKQVTLQSFDHQEYPYEELINELQVPRDTSRNPLFDVLFSFLNYKASKIELPGLTLSQYKHNHEVSQFDLTMIVAEHDQQLSVELEYATALFDQSRIEGFLDSFLEIINQVLADPSVKLSEITLLKEEEKAKILMDFNATAIDFEAAEKTLVSAFDACAKANAQAPALTFEGKTLTYQELNEKSNALAHTLLERGIQLEDRIGVLVPRSAEMIISLLAVQKAGGAYIPLDPNYPSDRVLDIIEDSGLKLLITGDEVPGVLSAAIKVPTLKVTDQSNWSSQTDLPNINIRPDNLAYLIYTSGSTGRPKGVMIEHQSVINFIYGVRDRIYFEPDATMFCLTTVSFDIFVLESFLPLLTGMRVVLANEGDQQDPAALLRLAHQEKVEMMQITPSHLNMLLTSTSDSNILSGVHTLMVGGEAISQELLSKVKERFEGRVYNMYGPTETTIWSTIQDLTDLDQVGIGKPIANTTIRIMDQDMNLQPIGIVGELCIGGVGLARGYWNRDALTEEKFLADPYSKGGKIYKTGDLARWNADGTIVCLGRKDDQVKIRGFRIEPGEVEHQLSGMEHVGQAVVVVREVAGEKQLVGYYTAAEALDSTQLRMELSDHLPEYMIPAYLVQMDQFPLTPNGKINRNALPEPKLSGALTDATPVTASEEVVLSFWQQVLGIQEVGTDIDFFLAGGNSIKLIELFKLLDGKFPGTIKVRTLFQYPTIQKMARHIDDHTKKEQQPSKKKNRKIEF